MSREQSFVQQCDDEPVENPPGSVRIGAATASSGRGLGARFLNWLAPRKRTGTADRATRLDESCASRQQRSSQPGNELQGMTSRLIAQDRYAFVLLREAIGQVTEVDARSAWQSLNSQMALIPAGTLPLIQSDGSLTSVELAAFYLDRCAVTNRQFQRFVQAGGYDDMEIWPQEVWPSLMRFTDRTGRPGPRHWENGKYPASKGRASRRRRLLVRGPGLRPLGRQAAADAPPSGRRPAAGPSSSAAGPATAIPGATSSTRAAPTSRRPASVADRPGARVPDGVDAQRHLPDDGERLGVARRPARVDPVRSPGDPSSLDAPAPDRRRRLRHLFPGEATCHYVTGQPELDRRENIGFRCCVSVDRLRPHALSAGPSGAPRHRFTVRIPP